MLTVEKIWTGPDPESGKNYPESGKNHPKSGQNNPESGKNYPGSSKHYPESGKNRPESSKNFPVSGQNHPGSGGKIYLSPEYMDPKDAKFSLENSYQSLPESRPKTSMSTVAESKRPKSGQKRQNKSKFDRFFKPCLNVHQRRVVKYNMLLSIAINFLVFALGATGFVSIINGNASEKPTFQYGNVMILFKIICR